MFETSYPCVLSSVAQEASFIGVSLLAPPFFCPTRRNTHVRLTKKDYCLIHMSTRNIVLNLNSHNHMPNRRHNYKHIRHISPPPPSLSPQKG